MGPEQLKENVKKYWNIASCGTEFIKAPKYSKEYFEAIEEFRYTVEPEIFSFAQFTRFYNKKVLEIGIGAGTDFIQWIRAGADTYGVDLTQEAITNATNRLKIYELTNKNIFVSDAENLPFNDNFFDLTYSWGVIHHSPDPIKCLSEIIRVTKPGGCIKIMIYNRHSLFAFYRYIQCGLFKGKPFTSFKKILFYHQESLGTKAYTTKEIKKILTTFSVKTVQIKATATNHDLLYYRGPIARFFAYCLACIFGWNRIGWYMTIELKKEL